MLDVCAGTQGDLDPRPVTSDTLFNCFSVSKAVSAVALHQLVEQRLLSYDDPVCSVWPEFAEHGKESCTVRHVLTHSAGLQEFPGRGLTLQELCDWDLMLDAVARAQPTTPPGAITQYHYLSFGWIVGGIVRAVTRGQHLRRHVRQRIAYPLGLENEMFMGLGDEDLPVDYEDLRPRLATVSNAFLDLTQDDALTPENLQQMLTQIRQTYVHRGPDSAIAAAGSRGEAASLAADAASAATATANPDAAAAGDGSGGVDAYSGSDAELRETLRRQAAAAATPEQQTAQYVEQELRQAVPADAPEDVRHYLQVGLAAAEEVKREVAADAPGWTFVQEKNGVRISSKKMPHNPLSMVKGEGVIKCPPEGIVAIVAEQANKASWDKMYKAGRVLQQVSEDCRVLYDSYNRIWPTAPRDFCSVALVERHVDGSVVMANRSVQHPDCPEVDGVVRANVMLGGIVLKPLPESNYEHSHITYLMFVDVGGEIPTFVLNKIANDQPMCVAGLREVAERLPNRHALVRRPPVQLPGVVGGGIHPVPVAAGASGTAGASGAPSRSQQGLRGSAMSSAMNSSSSLNSAVRQPSQPLRAAGRQTPGAAATAAPQNTAAMAATISSRVSQLLNGTDGAGEGGEGGEASSATDGSLLVDPCMHNSDKIRRACLPSSNGHFSARALARLFAALAGDGTLDGAHILSPSTISAMAEVSANAGPAAWGLGVRVFTMRRPNGRLEASAFGHSGMGGSMVLCDPQSQFSVAVTVNRLTFERQCTLRVINTVSNLLGLGTLDSASAI